MAGLVGASAALFGSCSLSPTVKATSVAEVPDPDARLRWGAIRVERDLAALVAAAASVNPDRAEQLTSYVDVHRRHVAILREEGPLPRLADRQDDVAAPEPPSASAALDALVAAEEAAVETHVGSCGSCQGPRLASVLASIAASDAGVATVMGTW